MRYGAQIAIDYMRRDGQLFIRKPLRLVLAAIVLFSALIPAGCATSSSFFSRALSDNSWPRKRVMLMPATVLTGIPLDELQDALRDGLGKTLRRTGSFDVYDQGTIEESRFFEPGEPVDPELIRAAKEMGMNAIIFETINPIEINPAKSGMWPFRRKARRFTVSMNVDIVDANRGTILLSKEISENITLSDEEALEEKGEPASGETKKWAFRQCLHDILKKTAKAAILSLNRQVWTGTIVSADKEGIIINAGHDVGLRTGVVFEVFGGGESITSFKGQTYQLPGPKVGEIRLFEIKARRSSAEPLDGTDFKSGQMIRVKK